MREDGTEGWSPYLGRQIGPPPLARNRPSLLSARLPKARLEPVRGAAPRRPGRSDAPADEERAGGLGGGGSGGGRGAGRGGRQQAHGATGPGAQQQLGGRRRLSAAGGGQQLRGSGLVLCGDALLGGRRGISRFF